MNSGRFVISDPSGFCRPFWSVSFTWQIRADVKEKKKKTSLRLKSFPFWWRPHCARLSHLSDNDSTKATCHLGQMKALTPEETSRWPDLCLGAWRVNHSSKWRQSKKQALRCLPERICREVLVSCQSSWWAVKSHQGAVISERTAVKTHMVLVEAGGNWIKEILLETLASFLP